MAIGLKMVNGDFVFDPAGRLEFVSDTDKCIRDLHKFLVTNKSYDAYSEGFERYNPNYGTDLSKMELYQDLSRNAAREVVIGLLNEAIAYYIELQESRDNLDYGEIITGVNFDVYYNPEDIRQLIVSVTVATLLSGEIALGEFIQQIV